LKENLRNGFGPKIERDGTWRIKTNDALDKLIRNKIIENHIKTQKLSWFGHLQRMAEVAGSIPDCVMEFFIDINLSMALWLWSRPSL
jgi:hypothetical protein